MQYVSNSRSGEVSMRFGRRCDSLRLDELASARWCDAATISCSLKRDDSA